MNVGSGSIKFTADFLPNDAIASTQQNKAVHGNRYQTKEETDTYSYVERRHHLILLNGNRKAKVMKKAVIRHNAL